MGGGFFGLVFTALFKDDDLQPSKSSANVQAAIIPFLFEIAIMLFLLDLTG
jgi:hypothetical protein